jgi:hypothetical protein
MSWARVARLATGAGIVGAAVAGTAMLPGGGSGATASVSASGAARGPLTQTLVKSRSTFTRDVRSIPQLPPRAKRERPEREAPETLLQPGGVGAPVGSGTPDGFSAPAPGPLSSFDGLHFTESCTGGQCGAGHPPDTNGDVGPTYYIQAINVGIGIYNKSNGQRVAGLTFDNFMSQGSFGNLCDTDNFGDPVVIYDTFADRWIITDFAFQLDMQGNINPQVVYQCFAVSRSGDPVAGGWNFYSMLINGGIDDYPKFGIWPDGFYMTANMFDYSATGGFQNVRVWALNKAQMYAGTANPQIVSFNAPAQIGPAGVFSMLPSNARLQTGTPPSGSPNYLSLVWGWTNRVRIWKFHVDWNNTANSTFTGPTDSALTTTWAGPPVDVPSKSGNNLDTLGPRLMMQNQYTNIGGVESLWNAHTVRGSSSLQSAVRYYQVKVTGGDIEATATQGATWNPDSSNRFIPSVAVDRAGDMALGYSVSSSTLFPAIRYAGRLSTDPVNVINQTENTFIEGSGSQVGSCGGTCTRWGDYSAMTLDPDGCTFWYTSEYYVGSGLDHHTRIGSFSFPACTKTNQTIVFGALADKTFGDADFAVSAVASSGLAVSFAASGSCTVSGSTVHLTGIGSCTLTASQPGDANYNAAADVPRTFAIAKASQTITLGAVGGKTYGDADFAVTATASSGLAVALGAAGSCTIGGATVHITAAGSCTVSASQPGDTNYNPAADVAQTIAVAKAAQAIVFGPLPNKRYGAANFNVTASASSGLAVSFSAGGKCTVNGRTVHLTGAGSCTLRAAQVGDSNYNAATSVARSFKITACTVPKVVGKSLARAKALIAKRGCRTGKVRTARSAKSRGKVISQGRRAGRVLPRGAKINLVVSRGLRP